jgi:uracil-DNA glycosylase
MNPVNEFRSILDHIKKNIQVDMDMGLESPFIPDIFPGTQGEIRIKAGSLDELERLITGCERCKLHKGRTNLVFGEGDPRARLVFIGEGPGHDEDLAGKPFAGEAGRLLTRIIEAGMGLKMEEVYFLNIVKCRPPDNRTPERDEIDACLPILKEQVRIIKPEIICTLGRTAAHELLGKDFKITEQRGKWQSFMDIPVMPTYHPAYIIRNPSRERELKGQVWEDVKKIKTRLGVEVK